VVVGARGPLIAFNVNLDSNSIKAADDIAARIRKLRDSGEAMPGVRAIGVYLKSRGLAQVSVNITRTDLVRMAHVYSFIKRAAKSRHIEVLESELIGVAQETALTDAEAVKMKLVDFGDSRILERAIG
jgi:glutamate formiminotransferase